tara:strand:+ start:1393 stop:1719 length:327 start_codon:yes stop_codon:yes gene_type:complete
MAYSYVWEINEKNLVAKVSNGFVTTLVYRVKGMDGSEEKARHVGQVKFIEPSSLPSDFIEYKSLTAAKCLEWLKAALGATKVTSIENKLKAKIDLINTPTEKVGSPWS